MKDRKPYEPPTLKVFKVVLEDGVAQGYTVSIGAQLIDWEDGGTLGVAPEEGGDLYLIF